MSEPILAANSRVEAHLYVMANVCPTCGTGARQWVDERSGANPTSLTLIAACGNCSATDQLRFDIAPSDAPQSSVATDAVSTDEPINPAGRPSRIIDPIQWVTLAQLMADEAEATPDTAERRWRLIRAAECLDEALRFYDGESELPDPAVRLAPRSAISLRDHPQRYARSRLLALRQRFPARSATQRVERVAAARGRPWWRFWSRGGRNPASGEAASGSTGVPPER
jgi:hypothetical protein